MTEQDRLAIMAAIITAQYGDKDMVQAAVDIAIRIDGLVLAALRDDQYEDRRDRAIM
jgi:hypothetical protein